MRAAAMATKAKEKKAKKITLSYRSETKFLCGCRERCWLSGERRPRHTHTHTHIHTRTAESGGDGNKSKENNTFIKDGDKISTLIVC